MAKPNRGMLEGPLLPAIVSYAIPIIFTSLLQLLFNAALPCPILANCFQGVGTAGRPEPAPGRKIGRNIALIEGNEGKKHMFHSSVPSRRIPAFFARAR